MDPLVNIILLGQESYFSQSETIKPSMECQRDLGTEKGREWEEMEPWSDEPCGGSSASREKE